MTATPPDLVQGTGGRGARGRDPERRRALLEAADTVIQRDGPDASMAAIAAEACISKPILYRHFGDKSGLYRALAKRHVDALMERVSTEFYGSSTLRQRTRATIAAYLGMIRANLNLYRFLMHRATGEDPRTRGDVGMMVRRLGEELGDMLAAEGQIPDPLRARIVAHAVIGMVREAGEWWLDNPRVAPDTIIDHLTVAVAAAIENSGPA